MKWSNLSIIIGLSLALSPQMLAQTLTGRVLNGANSQPIKRASIYIEDLKTGTLTDDDGNYTLVKVHAGTYLVTARSLGHNSVSKIVTIKGKTEQDFILAVSTYEAEGVVVTGNAIATTARNTTQPVTEVSHNYLMQNASTNIIDALSRVPGVSGITDGQSISKPVIRGLGYNRVVTIADGIRQEGQQWGDEFGIEVDQNSVDRVEILKGPASLIYGSDAISGVINLLPEKTLAEGQIKGDILYNYQDNNGLMNTSAHIAGTVKGISFSGRISNIMAHAYQNQNDGYVFNSQFSNLCYEGTVGIHRRWGYSQLHYSYFELKTGIVEGERDSATGKFVKQVFFDSMPNTQVATNQDLKSYTPFLINQDVRHYKLVWDNSLAVGNGRIIAKVGWQQNRRQENNDISQPDVSNIYCFLNTINYDLHYVSPTWNKFNFSAGVNGMYQNSMNKGTLLLIPEYNLFDIGGFFIASKKIGNLSLSAGVRYDNRQFNGKDDYIDSNGNQLSSTDPAAIHQFKAYSSSFSGLSASLGANYQLPGGFYVKANAAKGFRAPNVAESGSNGIHDGTVVYEIGDPNLKAESNVEFDLNPGVTTKDFSVDLCLFLNNINNFIYARQVLDSAGIPVVNNSVPGFTDAPVFKYTQGDAISTGMELAIDVHPYKLKWFDWFTTFSTVDVHLKDVPDSAKYLPFTPPTRLKSDITLTLKKLTRNFRNSYVRFGIYESFEQNKLSDLTATYYALPELEQKASMSPTAAYTLLNAGLGTDFVTQNRKAFSVYISIDNLANTSYVDYMSRFKYYPVNYGNGVNRVGVYNMGRNISIKLVIPLDFKG